MCHFLVLSPESWGSVFFLLNGYCLLMCFQVSWFLTLSLYCCVPSGFFFFHLICFHLSLVSFSFFWWFFLVIKYKNILFYFIIIFKADVQYLSDDSYTLELSSGFSHEEFSCTECMGIYFKVGNQSFWSNFKNFIYSFIYFVCYGYFACVYVFIPHVCLVLLENQRRSWIIWYCLGLATLMLEIKPGSLEEQPVLLAIKLAPQSPTFWV